MKLKYNIDYLSIKKFDPIELPTLTVLTGLNGAGKTHLVEGILNGSIAVDGIDFRNITHFNSSNFYLDPENETTAISIISDRAMLESQFRARANEELEIRKTFFGDDEFKVVLNLAAYHRKSFYDLNEKDFEKSIKVAFHQYRNYRIRIEQLVGQLTPPAFDRQFVLRLVKRINKPIAEITEADVEEFYTPFNQKNNLLVTQLGRVFVEYHNRWEQIQYNEFRNSKYGSKYPVLTYVEFKKKYGEEPWKLVNSILENYSALDYEVNYPNSLERADVFKLKLKSKSSPELEIDFETLSSGEKTMLALVSCLYKSKIEMQFPQLVLLDEIDAVLHPSMITNLFKILEESLTSKGVNVILVTHSPSTVALAPDDSIYLMQRSGSNRVTKTTKEAALNVLTEGFASLSIKEYSLKLDYALKKSALPVLLTEGITDRIIIETAWSRIYTENMPFEVQDCFDVGFLKNLMKRGEIFRTYSSRKFLALFDFDEEGYQNWRDLGKEFEMIQSNPLQGLVRKKKTSNGYGILLPVPDNRIKHQVIKSGNETFEDGSHMPIELLFADVTELVSSFKEEIQAGGGKIIKFIGDKVDFAENKISLLPKEAFKNFKPLFETIKGLLG